LGETSSRFEVTHRRTQREDVDERGKPLEEK